MHKSKIRLISTVPMCLVFISVFFSYTSRSDSCYAVNNISVNDDYQEIVENKLDSVVAKTGSVGGSVVLKDIDNDRVLAMASNAPSHLRDACGNHIDLAINSWEPGSVIKPLLMEYVINETGIDLDTEFNVVASQSYGGDTIYDHTIFEPGYYRVKDISRDSINTGTVSIFESLDEDAYSRRKKWFHALTEIYGFGKPTGYNISNEDVGRVPSYYHIDKVNYRYGLSTVGISMYATPLQVVNAYDTALVDSQKLKESSIWNLKKILEYNLATDTRYSLDVWEGYSIGGKTGTSSMIDEYLNYEGGEIGSFIGYIETEGVRFIALVQLVSPESEYASHQAKKGWSDIMETLIEEGLIL